MQYKLILIDHVTEHKLNKLDFSKQVHDIHGSIGFLPGLILLGVIIPRYFITE